MNRERFEMLAQAHGGDVARWPEAEQDAAALMMAAEPDFTAVVLAQAAELDAAMDAWASLPVSHDLRAAVIATAPRQRPPARSWFWRAGLGAGLAAACAAGIVLGVQFSDTVAQPDDTVSAALSGYDDLSGIVSPEGA